MNLNTNESDSEPFSAGSSDDYEPKSSDYSDLENKNDTTRRPNYKQNIVKNESVVSSSGEEHINTADKVVPARKTGPGGTCRKKCFERFGPEKRQTLLKRFNNLGVKITQDNYIAGLITTTIPVRFRVNLLFCRFSLGHMLLIAQHISKPSTITAPQDMRRGKHRNKLNAIPLEVTENINKHIKKFPRKKLHYGRSKNLGLYYLSSELNIKMVYELYLAKFEPNMRILTEQNRKKTSDFKPKGTYDFFFRYFKSNFPNYRFGRPRSDTCQKCDMLENRKKFTTTEENLKSIKTELRLDQSKAQTFFSSLTKKTELAKNDPIVDTLCVDFQQNAPLPKVPSGDAFYLRQLWMFDIRHRHASFPITLSEVENKAYDDQFALQKLKYDNVMTLAGKYCMPYYRSLKNNSQNDKGETDMTDDNSGPED
ncbi:hypothetical protein ILUMI_20267 [Ignelater luminosus]|uniref:Uncharacterized protein n=1 Tax=Ignelater luminosus TaxID=2038154 RepID=A0A8K0CEL5_IGNLU|nr:hypothetical protein ILUMI_20267 [Ignelater luminosus]